MKRTLLTTLLLAASLGLAYAASEGQETITFKNVMPSLIDASGASAITFVTKGASWVNWPKEPKTCDPEGFLSNEDFATDVKSLGLQEEGWKFFMGDGTNGNSTDVTGVSSNGFKFIGRKAYCGEVVTATTSVARLLTDNNATNLTSFTVNFAVNHTANESGTAPCIYVGLWSYNTTTNLATLLKYTGYDAHEDTSPKTLTADNNLSLGANDVVIVSWFNQSAGQTNEVSNVSFSAEGQKSAPEPTAAALSFLALAGLAARRRRR